MTNKIGLLPSACNLEMGVGSPSSASADLLFEFDSAAFSHALSERINTKIVAILEQKRMVVGQCKE